MVKTERTPQNTKWQIIFNVLSSSYTSEYKMANYLECAFKLILLQSVSGIYINKNAPLILENDLIKQ
jgi:hypothetical protein